MSEIHNEDEQNERSKGIQITDEYLQIFGLLEKKAPIIFAGGKAGTGKTTFISCLKVKYGDKMVVVAFTGVAALSCGGMTIHGLFQLPPRIANEEDIKVIDRNKELFESMSLLVIDEISMVRADVMDAIDHSLRKNRGSDEPFGGVQLLLLGDLFQLQPILGKADAEALELMGYEGYRFYDALIFKQVPIRYKELTKVFRQADPKFIDLLDKVREGKDLDKVIPILNQRCI